MSVRKGYSRVQDIPSELLQELETGKCETATLAEITAINLPRLVVNCLDRLTPHDLVPVENEKGILKKMRASAGIISSCYGHAHHAVLQKHSSSDMIRGLGAFIVGTCDAHSIEKKMAEIQIYASDKHFGVREWSWMAVREVIVADFSTCYPFLEKMSKSKDPNIRRFAIEGIRPKGVWATHLKLLKKDPALASSILENLKNDESRYVQDSVGNWLNDLSKDNAAWVSQLCDSWARDKKVTDSTRYIIKRATRNIGEITT